MYTFSVHFVSFYSNEENGASETIQVRVTIFFDLIFLLSFFFSKTNKTIFSIDTPYSTFIIRQYASCLSLRLDYHWSNYSFKQSIAMAGRVMAFIILLCLPMIRLAFLLLTIVLLNMSMHIRRCYVRILAFIFDYATKIKKGREIVIDIDRNIIESSVPSLPIDSMSTEDCDIFYEAFQMTSKTFMNDRIQNDDQLDISSIQSSPRRSRMTSQSAIHFRFGKIRSLTCGFRGRFIDELVFIEYMISIRNEQDVDSLLIVICLFVIIYRELTSIE
jgi:hypothetical protein